MCAVPSAPGWRGKLRDGNLQRPVSAPYAWYRSGESANCPVWNIYCGGGSWGGWWLLRRQRPGMGCYVTGMGATSGASAAGGR